MTTPINTYNSGIELILGNVPSDIDTPEGLFRELLDIHNAIDGLIIHSDDMDADDLQLVASLTGELGRLRAQTVSLGKTDLDLAQLYAIMESRIGKLESKLNSEIKVREDLEQLVHTT